MKYITKTELCDRWSLSLIDKYYPQCSEERTNPHYASSSPMQLYDVAKVLYIESLQSFKDDYKKVLKRKNIAYEREKKKYKELLMYVHSVQIMIPDLEKNELINQACNHYNCLNSQMQFAYNGLDRATPSRETGFLKRITIEYLRHLCTRYEEELEKFHRKSWKNEASKILQARINDAIIQKYEWLK